MNMSRDHWNTELYDEKHSFVSKYGEDLVELLAPKQGEAILDVGCGTGDLAYKLYERGVNVTGIDQSEKMINQAKKKYPFIAFELQNVVHLSYENAFDAIFSNAVLHWVKQPKEALSCMYLALKRNGRFVAEFGGKGNVQLIVDELIKQLKAFEVDNVEEKIPWYFPSIGEYATLMEEVGFRVVFAQHFDRPTPLEGERGLVNWLHMFAVSMFEGVDEKIKEEIVVNVENSLRNILFQENRWFADYKRIRVIGIKQ
ncbi:MAG: methyltransferase domain-containing protein [Anoxybacillus sp.]|nr:methyltransferase domain-containing protein [Anoxybacillus sp.]